jgi:hypothetical protein
VRRSTLCAITALAAVAISPVAGAATTTTRATTTARHPRASATQPQVFFAHLRIHVVTTSAWTAIDISPGMIASSRLGGVRGSGSWQVQTAALVLNGAHRRGRKSVTANLIYEDLTSKPNLHLTVQKGDNGLTHITISDVTGKTVTTVRALTDRATSPAHPSHTRQFVFSRARLLGTRPARLPRADPRKLVLAFYYPWYPKYNNPELADHPRQPRSTYTQAGVDSMTAQAKANGINGFIQSWAGEKADGKQFRLALRAAHRQHQVISGYLESAMAASNVVGAERDELNWLVQLLHYGKRRSFLKAPSGVPVVFVYSMNRFTPSEWRYILGQVRNRHHLRVDLVGDDAAPSYLPFDWGVHRYTAVGPVSGLRDYSLISSLNAKARAALYPRARKKLFAATVSPGYDDQRERGKLNPIIPRDGGRRYRRSWKAALAGQPDWVLVTSWNEWFEDTEVEPGRRTGSGALALTRLESKAWKRG